MGLENLSDCVGSRDKVQTGALLLWALRRIFGRGGFVASGFPQGVGVLEGCRISNTATMLPYRGWMIFVRISQILKIPQKPQSVGVYLRLFYKLAYSFRCCSAATEHSPREAHV